MHVTRSRAIRYLRSIDRFRIFYPVTGQGRPIYVHAKLMVVDDSFLRVGSSNIDRRSMGFDTECDVAISRPDAACVVFRSIRYSSTNRACLSVRLPGPFFQALVMS